MITNLILFYIIKSSGTPFENERKPKEAIEIVIAPKIFQTWLDWIHIHKSFGIFDTLLHHYNYCSNWNKWA